MHRTVTTWTEFKGRWSGVHNFLMSGECVPFAFDLPHIDRILEEVRQDPGANVHSGTKGPKLHTT